MSDHIFHTALQTILREIFDGSTKREGYLLNPGDPGLLTQLDSITAAAASSRSMPGQTTIAAHVDRVDYHVGAIRQILAATPRS